MKTRVSTKGQVVLPEPLRRRLDIRVGDDLDVAVDSGRVVLTPRRKPARRARIVTDELTGLPVLTFGASVPKLTGRDVKAILAEFP